MNSALAELLESAPSDLTHAEILVLVAIFSGANTLAAIARRARIEPQSARNTLHRLGSKGLVARRHGHIHRGQRQHYTLDEVRS